MIINTDELEGAALDWAVCMAAHGKDSREVWAHPSGDPGNPYPVKGGYRPSTDWAQGGPLIDRHHVALNAGAKDTVRGIFATARRDHTDGPHGCGFGPTRLIAAMRAIVAASLGDEVDVPDELGGDHD